jgi:hypothetical protein
MDATDVTIWILVVVGAGVFAAVRMWRQHVRRQAAALQSVAENIRLLRRMAGHVPRMEPVTASTPVPEGLGPITRELEAAGFRRLGDLVEYLPDGAVAGVTRWVVSADGLIHGWAGVTPQGPAATLLVTEDPATGFVTTLRGPDAPGVAVPPNVIQQRVPWEAGLDAALERHRAELAQLTNPVRVSDLASAQGSFGRLYGQVRAWRSTQTPEQLLEADVRKITGARFDDLGPTLITIVQALDDVESAMAEMERRGRAVP